MRVGLLIPGQQSDRYKGSRILYTWKVACELWRKENTRAGRIPGSCVNLPVVALD